LKDLIVILNFLSPFCVILGSLGMLKFVKSFFFTTYLWEQKDLEKQQIFCCLKLDGWELWHWSWGFIILGAVFQIVAVILDALLPVVQEGTPMINATFWEQILTIPNLMPLLAIIIAAISLWLSLGSNKRAERLYQAQRVSDIIVTPISFKILDPETKPIMATLCYNLINYTGFKASNIRVDVSFSNVWIKEWVINAAESLQEKKNKGELLTEKEENELTFYKRQVAEFKVTRFELKPKQVSEEIKTTGEFTSQENKLKIRISWESENKAPFGKFYTFNIERSEAHGKYFYVLIPEIVTSVK
jgi:hypothetical protein